VASIKRKINPMKKVPFLFTFAIALLWLTAIVQAQTPQQMASWLVADSWVADQKSMEIALLQTFKPLEAQQMTPAQRQELQQKKTEAFQALFVLGQIQVRFNNNGTYNLRVQNTDFQQGTWQMAADGKHLIFDGSPVPLIKLSDTHLAYPISQFMNLYLVAESKKGDFLLEENEFMAVPLNMAGSYPKSRIKIVPAPDGKTHRLTLLKQSEQDLPLLYVQWQGSNIQHPLMQIADAKTDIGTGEAFTHYDWAEALAARQWLLLDDATGRPVPTAKVSVKKEAMELVTLDFTISNGGKKTSYHCEVYNNFTISCKPEGDTKFSMTPTVMLYQLATWSIAFVDTNEGKRLFTLVQESPIF
jgi:hypothetical protein